MSQRSALLVVDVQQSFEHRPYWSDADLGPFREKLCELMWGCQERDIPVIGILHVESEGAFSRASGLVKPMNWVPQVYSEVICKHVHNAFTDTDLGARLKALGVDHLVVSGIRTEQCCETTTRVAFDLGYAVDFVTEATLTFPMTHPLTGHRYSTKEIKDKTELVLAERFATIKTVAQCLADLPAAVGATG